MNINFLPACLILFFSTISNAQINKGSMLLGGSLSFYSTKDEISNIGSGHTNTYSISPSVGKAIRNNIIIGIQAHYFGSSEFRDLKGWGAAVFTRKYIPLGKSFYFFGELTLNYSFFKSQSFQADSTGIIYSVLKDNNIFVGIKPGFSFSVNRHLQLEISFRDILSTGYEEQRMDSGIPRIDRKKKSFYFVSELNPGTLSYLQAGVRFFINNK